MNVGPCISPPPSPPDTRLGDRARAQRGGERHVAAGERLADAHHVRGHAGVLAGEQRAGAPEAGGDLVEHEQQPVLVAQPRAAARRTRASERACPPRPARPARRSPPPARALWRGDQLAHVRRPALVEPGVEPVGRALGEDVLGQHAGEQAVHPADRVAHAPSRRTCRRGSRPSPSAAACARAPERALELQAHLDRDLHRHRPGVGEEHRAPRPAGRDLRAGARPGAPPARA